MLTRVGWFPLVLLVACGGAEGTTGMGWEGPESGTGVADASGVTTNDDPSSPVTSEGDDSTGGSIDPSVGDDSTSGDPPIDCTPAWSPAFVGSPCASDRDCAFEGGYCITEGEGFEAP